MSLFFFTIHRKAQDLDHVLILDQGADPDLKTDLVPDLVLILDHATSALDHDHAADHDPTHRDATDHTPSRPGIPDPSPVPSHDLDQNPHRSPGLDHAPVLHLDHQEMRKLGLLSQKQMKIRITIQQMETMRCSKLSSQQAFFNL